MVRYGLRVLVTVLGLLAVASVAAQADSFTGTGTFADNGPANNGLSFTGVTNNALLNNIVLAVGQPQTLTNFLSITSTDAAGSLFGTTETDNISENFTFTSPSPASGSLTGTGSETVYSLFCGLINFADGSISWANPLTLDFADGEVLQISLSNAKFDTVSFLSSPRQTVQVNATLNLVKGATSVPEPSSLMLLGSGGIAAITFLRKKRL